MTIAAIVWLVTTLWILLGVGFSKEHQINGFPALLLIVGNLGSGAYMASNLL